MSLQTGWNNFPFKEIRLEPGNFADELKGLRIVQLSDLQMKKSLDIHSLENLVKRVNALHPDIVVFTGDILQTFAFRLRKHFRVFRGLEAAAYYVTGNHDIVYGPKTLKKEFSHNGIICLDNSIAMLNINNTPLQLVGLSDRHSFTRRIERPIDELFCRLDENISTILLTHDPKDIEHTFKYRFDIQLSGHAHSPQPNPFNKFVKRFKPYASGVYVHGKTLLYVTQGLRQLKPTTRHNLPNEIPVFTIV